MQWGGATILKEGNLHMRKGGVMVLPATGSWGLISCVVEADADSGASSSGIGTATSLGIAGVSPPGVVEALKPRIAGESSSEIATITPEVVGASSLGVAGAASPETDEKSPIEIIGS